MNVLQQFVCSVIVFITYTVMGYYRPYHLLSAVWAFFSEKRKLNGQVLAVKWCGIPLGTLMVSKDQGWLPIDVAFPKLAPELREKYGKRWVYYGKFGVIPWLQGGMVGHRLLEQAVFVWSEANGVDVAVMMVHPKHVRKYAKYGAVELARTGGTKGLEKAPAVLMVLDYNNSPKLLRLKEEFFRRTSKKEATLNEVAA